MVSDTIATPLYPLGKTDHRRCEFYRWTFGEQGSTDYGNFLQNEPSPLAVSTIVEKATRKLVEEFRHMRCQASQPLATFLDYLTYGYMIDNVVLIVTGTLHERDVQVRASLIHTDAHGARFLL